MLTYLMRVGLAIRRRRRSLGLTQRMVGAAVECSQPYICQVERGRRPVSEQIARKLEEVLEAPGMFTCAPFLRGRPPLVPLSKQVSKTLRRGASETEPTPDLGRRPRYKQEHQRWGIEDRLAWLGPVTEKLEEERGADERYWRSVNSLRYDSGSEVRLIGRLSGLGGQWTGLNLSKLGCSLTLINGKTGGPFQGTHRGFLFKHQGVSIAWVPQVPIRTRVKYRTPDNVLLISAGGRTITTVVEVAGSDFHTEEELRQRQAELGVPMFVVDAARVEDPNLLNEILEWAVSQLPEPAADVEVNRKGLALAVHHGQAVVGSGALVHQPLFLQPPSGQSANGVFLPNIQGVPGLLRAGTIVTRSNRTRESA
jgi:transcriptional regulator with XRE-family HTH domain